MSVPNRAATITHLSKVLAKHYKSVVTVERPLLEQLLFACFLEDSKPEVAEECFARLQQSFFDWNEVRVTTVRELTELMKGLTDPTRTATHLKQTLHSVFEALYSFDLEPLKKQNLGVAVKQLQQFRGTTPFTVSYVVQHGLGGHQIPVSPAGLELMLAINALSEAEFNEGAVPGLERAIPKTKGIEFASQFQQLAAEFAASPNSTHLKAVLAEIDPEAKNRIARRNQKKAEAEAAALAKAAAEKARLEQERAEKLREKNEKLAEKARKEKEKAAREAAKEAAAKMPKEAEKKKEPEKKAPEPKKGPDVKKSTDVKKVVELKKVADGKKEADAKKAASDKKAPHPADKKPSAPEKKPAVPEKKSAAPEKKVSPLAKKIDKVKAATKDASKDASKKAAAKKPTSSLPVKSVKKAAPKKAAPSPAAKKSVKKKVVKKAPPITKKATPSGKKSTSKQLARRKPR